MSYYADDFGYGDGVYEPPYEEAGYDDDADFDDYPEPDVDYMQEQNDFAHDDDFEPMEDQHLDGMYEE